MALQFLTGGQGAPGGRSEDRTQQKRPALSAFRVHRQRHFHPEKHTARLLRRTCTVPAQLTVSASSASQTCEPFSALCQLQQFLPCDKDTEWHLTEIRKHRQLRFPPPCVASHAVRPETRSARRAANQTPRPWTTLSLLCPVVLKLKYPCNHYKKFFSQNCLLEYNVS